MFCGRANTPPPNKHLRKDRKGSAKKVNKKPEAQIEKRPIGDDKAERDGAHTLTSDKEDKPAKPRLQENEILETVAVVEETRQMETKTVQTTTLPPTDTIGEPGHSVSVSILSSQQLNKVPAYVQTDQDECTLPSTRSSNININDNERSVDNIVSLFVSQKPPKKQKEKLQSTEETEDTASLLSSRLSDINTNDNEGSSDGRTSKLLAPLSPEKQTQVLEAVRRSLDKERSSDGRASALLASLSQDKQTEVLEAVRRSLDKERSSDGRASALLESLSQDKQTEVLEAVRRSLDKERSSDGRASALLAPLSPEKQTEVLEAVRRSLEISSPQRRFNGFDLNEEDEPVEGGISSILLSMSPGWQTEILEQFRRAVHDATTSTSKIFNQKDTNHEEDDKDTDISSFLASLSPEEREELLKRLREAFDVGHDATTSMSFLFKSKKAASSPSPQRRKELLRLLREAAGEGQESATSPSIIPIRRDIKQKDENKESILSSFLSSLSPEQRKDLLKRLQEEFGEGQRSTSRLFGQNNMKGEEPATERTISSFLLSLSPEQKKEFLKRLLEAIGNGQGPSASKISNENDMSGKEVAVENIISSVLLSLSPEQKKELLEQLLEAFGEGRSSQEKGPERSISSILSSLSPEQKKELLKRLLEAFREEQHYLKDERTPPERSISSFLSSLSPEQKRELLKRLLEALGDGQDSAVLRRMRQKDIDDEDANIERRIASFLSSLSPEQKKELLGRLLEAFGEGQKTTSPTSRLPTAGKYAREAKEESFSSLLSSLSPEQLKRLFERLQEVLRDGQSPHPKKDKGTPSMVIPVSPGQRNQIMEYLRKAVSKDQLSDNAKNEQVSSLLPLLTRGQQKEMFDYLRGSGAEDQSPNIPKGRHISSALSPLTLEQHKAMLEFLREATRVGRGADSPGLRNLSQRDLNELLSSLTPDQQRRMLGRLREAAAEDNSSGLAKDRGVSTVIIPVTAGQQKEMMEYLLKAVGNSQTPDRGKGRYVSSLVSPLTLEQHKEMLKFLREAAWNQDSKSLTSTYFNHRELTDPEVARNRTLFSILSSLSPEQQRRILDRLREADSGISSLILPLTAEQQKEMVRYLNETVGGQAASTSSKPPSLSKDAVTSTSVTPSQFNENASKKKSNQSLTSQSSMSNESFLKTVESAASTVPVRTGALKKKRSSLRHGKRAETPPTFDNLPRVVRSSQKARRSPRRQTSPGPDHLKPVYDQEPAMQIAVSNDAPVLIKYDSMNAGVILMPAPFVPSEHSSKTAKGAIQHKALARRHLREVGIDSPSLTSPQLELLRNRVDQVSQTDASIPNYGEGGASNQTPTKSGQKCCPCCHVLYPEVFCRYNRPLTDCFYVSNNHSSVPVPQKMQYCFDPLCQHSDEIMFGDGRPMKIIGEHGVSYAEGDRCSSSNSAAHKSAFVRARSRPTTQNLFTRHGSPHCRHSSRDFRSLAHLNVPCVSCNIRSSGLFPQVFNERALVCTELSDRAYRYCSCLESSGSDSSVGEIKSKKRKNK